MKVKDLSNWHKCGKRELMSFKNQVSKSPTYFNTAEYRNGIFTLSYNLYADKMASRHDVKKAIRGIIGIPKRDLVIVEEKNVSKNGNLVCIQYYANCPQPSNDSCSEIEGRILNLFNSRMITSAQKCKVSNEY